MTLLMLRVTNLCVVWWVLLLCSGTIIALNTLICLTMLWACRCGISGLLQQRAPRRTWLLQVNFRQDRTVWFTWRKLLTFVPMTSLYPSFPCRIMWPSTVAFEQILARTELSVLLSDRF